MLKIAAHFSFLLLPLLMVHASEYCDTLLKQCNLFRDKCTADDITMGGCCDLTHLPMENVSSGVYKTQTDCGCDSTSPFATVNVNIYCDMNTTNGGWTIVQRNRKDSEVNFDTTWAEYEEGFGDLNTEFWYGLKWLHCLTKSGEWEMRLDYQKSDKSWSYMHYTQFSVGTAAQEYPLSVGGYTGIGGDRFKSHNNRKFTTKDNDNDIYSTNCATKFPGGWWYYNCYDVQINLQPPQYAPRQATLFTEMKIRPKNC
ncbi:fibrinogen-like protein A [Dysidea avara]|uniref:fibrinogen-like protein A n=1 Tax=Dysidea avara TaxID=196820 RepID=UPI0033201A0B